jgi:hypothetical protein
LSFHCGSAQFFATISGDSVALAGATGVSPEHAHNSAANRTTNPNRIDASPLLSSGIGTGAPSMSFPIDRRRRRTILTAGLWRLHGNRDTATRPQQRCPDGILGGHVQDALKLDVCLTPPVRRR